MGRTKVTPIQQPDDTTCGPAAVKLALHILGKKKSLVSLMRLCKTNRNGTSTQNMITALNKLGYSVLIVQYATLHHLQSALKYRLNQERAILVSYLYDLDDDLEPLPESGHWAVVSGYLASKSRIVILDSVNAKKKSYAWNDFRKRWIDFDLKRRKTSDGFKLVRKWQPQLLMVVARDEKHLPKFRIATAQRFVPVMRPVHAA